MVSLDCILCSLFSDEPRIIQGPKDMKVMEDGVVSFFCTASGNPTPDIYWQRANKRITSNRQRYFIHDMPHGSVLRIEPAKPRKDDSIFECVADNGIGSPATAAAMLTVYDKDQGSGKGRRPHPIR